MKAAVLHEFGQPLKFESIADPKPGPDDVIVRVMACGIDGTDLKLLDGFGYRPMLPFVMGHEPAGWVEQAGANVSDFQRGDRVIPYIFLIPPESRWYRSAREQLCPEMAGVIGVMNSPGGYAEKLCVKAKQLIRVPETVTWHDAGVLCDAGLTAWHAVGRAGIQPGDTVLVIGAGGVGSFVIQLVRRAGARVIALEKSPAKLDWATRMGAHLVLDARHAEVSGEIRRLADGAGVASVLDIVGSSASMAIGLDSLRVGGRLVVVGYTPDELRLSPKRLAQGELEVIGSRGGTRRDLSDIVALAALGNFQSIVTQIFPLNQANEALAALRTGQVLGRLVLAVGAGW